MSYDQQRTLRWSSEMRTQCRTSSPEIQNSVQGTSTQDCYWKWKLRWKRVGTFWDRPRTLYPRWMFENIFKRQTRFLCNFIMVESFTINQFSTTFHYLIVAITYSVLTNHIPHDVYSQFHLYQRCKSTSALEQYKFPCEKMYATNITRFIAQLLLRSAWTWY